MNCAQGSSRTTYVPRESSALLRAVVEGAQGAFDELLRRWNDYITISAARYGRNPTDFDDLYQVGSLALWRSVARFDPSRGSFNHYACRAIKNSMIREMRKHEGDHLILALFDVDEKEVEGALQKRYPNDLRREVDRAMLNTSINSWVESLDEPLRKVYGLLYDAELDQRLAAQQMGVTQPRISQLKARLLKLGANELSGLWN